jgi:hypothetical protein
MVMAAVPRRSGIIMVLNTSTPPSILPTAFSFGTLTSWNTTRPVPPPLEPIRP